MVRRGLVWAKLPRDTPRDVWANKDVGQTDRNKVPLLRDTKVEDKSTVSDHLKHVVPPLQPGLNFIREFLPNNENPKSPHHRGPQFSTTAENFLVRQLPVILCDT